MGKREDLIEKLKSIIANPERLKEFIIENSNLPGPRGNLELAFALAKTYDNLDVLLEWLKITEERAGVNDPKSFPAFCAAVCLGKIYTKTKDKNLISILKKLANDGRWRMREAVAFGFQTIGENDFKDLKSIFSQWIKNSNNLEKRAILVSLAHPKFLNEENAKFSLEVTDIVLREMDRGKDFDVLKKGLAFTISVFAAANPEPGFKFIKKWIGMDKDIDKIMKENLKKNRLSGKYPQEVKSILNYI